MELVEAYKRGEIDEEEYTRVYNQQLAGLDAHKVIEDLNELGGGDFVVMCLEKSGRFCHRHLFAAWARSAGYDVKEE